MRYRFIIPIALAITLGFVVSNLFYKVFDNPQEKTLNNSFFIELKGNYEEEAISKLKTYIKVKEKNKEYICVGITSNKDNSNKIKKYYESNGFNVDIKESYIKDETFYNNLVQYDILLSEVNKDEDLLSISKVILSSYEDLLGI